MLIFGISAVYFSALVVLALIELITVSVESYGWSTFWLISLIALLKISKVAAFASLPSLWVLIPSYIGIGLLWSLVKWVKYSRDWMRENSYQVRQARTDFCQQMGYTSLEKSHRGAFLKYLFSPYGYESSPGNYIKCKMYWNDNLLVKNNIERFIGWGFFWPFGMLGFFLKEPILLVYKLIINNILSPVYRWITQSSLSVLDKD